MRKTTLVVLAAGMGSRYGGLKQMDPIGPHGEAILEFSAYDAIRAGFNKIVFIIKREMEETFKAMISDRVAKKIEVELVFQELDCVLPQGYAVPEGRTKPWGTGHALICCKDVIDGAFAILNADDFYGKTSFQVLHDYLADEQHTAYALIGYKLENTLTDHGSVTRGICHVVQGNLTGVKECAKIERRGDQVQYYEDEKWNDVDAQSLVSMNMWGFFPEYIKELERRFIDFLENKVPKNPMKAEFLIPVVTDDMIHDHIAEVNVLHCDERWYGVTYQEDKPGVKAGIKELVDNQIYPNNLWK